MPPAPPFPPQNGAANNALFPALYLYPLNDTWAPKHIALTSQHTKIGRQTSSKTAPGERNGFFDSKVLSRQHAEVWEDGGKIFIKDVKSSNGTFINGERLSSEGHESEPFELKSDDIVEFGIDIVGEDNKTIIHHKVAARVVCVFSEQDAQVAARAEQHQQQQHIQQHQYLQQQQQHLQQNQQLPSQQLPSQHPSQQNQQQQVAGGPNGVNGMPAGVNGTQNFQFAAQRRAHLAQQGLGSMGGMRPPGKTGLSFDVILSRLQGEVQKSKETGAELGSLSGAMNEIQDTLGGALPATLPPFPSHLPPVRPMQEAPAAFPSTQTHTTDPSTSLAAASAPAPNATSDSVSTFDHIPSSSSDAAAVVSELQLQLRETQSSLAVHLDKVRALEDVLAEQAVLRREVGALRVLVEAKTGNGIEKHGHYGEDHDHDEREHHGRHDDEEEEESDDDDSRSTATTVPHELERVDEEDEEQLAAEAREDEERRQHQHEVDEDMEQDDEADHFRPREPRGHCDDGDDELLSEQERREVALRKEEDARMEAESVLSELSRGSVSSATPSVNGSELVDVDDEEERKREDLGVGRPHTPEPTRAMGLLNPRRRSLSSPLSQVSTSEFRHHHLDEDDDENPKSSKVKSPITTSATSKVQASTDAEESVHVQVQRLTQQVGAVLALTSSLEAQHAAAQGTILALEGKVNNLEGLLRNAEEALRERMEMTSSVATRAPSKVVESPAESHETEKESLTELLAAWKTSVEGQWGSVQQEWTLERERLARAREEWEARKAAWDTREARQSEWDAKGRDAEGGMGIQSMLAEHQSAIRELQLQQAQMHASSSRAEVRFGNGDVMLKHNGGLVTPPSPRSQSSDSGRYGIRRRRRRSSGSRGRESSRSRSQDSSADFVDEPSTMSIEDDSTSSAIEHPLHRDVPAHAKHGIARGLGIAAATATGSIGVHATSGPAAERSLATPEPSVYTLSASVGSLDGTTAVGSTTSSPTKGRTALATRENSEDLDPVTALSSSTTKVPISANAEGPLVPLNVQAALGVVLLSAAAAAVFWKVAPE